MSTTEKKQRAPKVPCPEELKPKLVELVALSKQLDAVKALRARYNDLRMEVLEQFSSQKIPCVKLSDFVPGEDKSVTCRTKKFVENPKKEDVQKRIVSTILDIDATITEEQAEQALNAIYEPISITENYVLSINGPKKRKGAAPVSDAVARGAPETATSE